MLFRSVYAARAVVWRGIFAVHTWIVVKPTDALRFTRYEVLGFGVSEGAPAIRIDRTGARTITGSALRPCCCSIAAGPARTG